MDYEPTDYEFDWNIERLVAARLRYDAINAIAVWTRAAKLGVLPAIVGWVFYFPPPMWTLCVILTLGSIRFAWLLWRLRHV